MSWLDGVKSYEAARFKVTFSGSDGVRLRPCGKCGGDGPCLWDDRDQRYSCVKCHSRPDDDFFARSAGDKSIEAKWTAWLVIDEDGPQPLRQHAEATTKDHAMALVFAGALGAMIEEARPRDCEVGLCRTAHSGVNSARGHDARDGKLACDFCLMNRKDVPRG